MQLLSYIWAVIMEYSCRPVKHVTANKRLIFEEEFWFPSIEGSLLLSSRGEGIRLGSKRLQRKLEYPVRPPSSTCTNFCHYIRNPNIGASITILYPKCTWDGHYWPPTPSPGFLSLMCFQNPSGFNRQLAIDALSSITTVILLLKVQDIKYWNEAWKKGLKFEDTQLKYR